LQSRKKEKDCPLFLRLQIIPDVSLTSLAEIGCIVGYG
jgi:hypothetical protein